MNSNVVIYFMTRLRIALLSTYICSILTFRGDCASHDIYADPSERSLLGPGQDHGIVLLVNERRVPQGNANIAHDFLRCFWVFLIQ